ncbi:MAG: hypothetical protein ACK5KT_15065 [Dysgonomonas sp.]
MISEKYKVLIDRLVSSTKKKLIKWEQTSSESKFKAKIGIGTITIEKAIEWDINGNPTGEYSRLAIINDEGIEADCIHLDNNLSNQTDYNLLEELYEVASDSTLKISDTIQSMLDELDKLDDIGKELDDLL